MAEPMIHVVAGLGPVGRAVINELVARRLPVRAITRRPVAGLPREVDIVQADMTDAAAAARAMTGAAVVYHAASAPYHRWPELLPPLMRGVLDGAAATDARIVYADNLYAYGPVDESLTEDIESRATGPNGRVRATLADQLMKAHAAGTVRATIGRASDYYGPWGRQSIAGERLFVPALAGKSTQVLGDPDLPHTFTSLGDFARGLVTLGTHDEALGEIWHLPSAETLSTRAFTNLVFEAAGQQPKLSELPASFLTVLALFSPTLRAVREQQYQREAPWVVDPFEVRPGLRSTNDAPSGGDRGHPRLVPRGGPVMTSTRQAKVTDDLAAVALVLAPVAASIGLVASGLYPVDRQSRVTTGVSSGH